MATIEIAPEAEQDGRDIADYLAREAGKGIADRCLADFERAIERLGDYPRLGAPRPQFGDLRIWVVAPYVVFYRYNRADDVVRVLRILHGRRDITAKLFEPSE